MPLLRLSFWLLDVPALGLVSRFSRFGFQVFYKEILLGTENRRL